MKQLTFAAIIYITFMVALLINTVFWLRAEGFFTIHFYILIGLVIVNLFLNEISFKKLKGVKV